MAIFRNVTLCNQSHTLVRLLLAVLVVCAVRARARAENWPTWRGAQGNGHSADQGFPLTWSATEAVKWKTELPGPGNSSPIVWDDQIFVTCASREGHRRSLMCFNRTDGQLNWQRHVEVTTDEPTHETNPYCSSSPVTDGQVVIAWHDSTGLHAYDLFGKPLWEFDPGLPPHVWGTGASPVIVDDLVILNCGATVRPYVVAVNKTTGKQVWRYEAIDSRAPNKTDFWGSWSTPVVLNSIGTKEIVIHLPRRLDALDAQTGARIWTARGPGPLAYATPLVGDDLIVATSGYHGPALAVRRGGENDVTQSHRQWLDDAKTPQRVGTGVLVDKHVYILNEPGIAWCLEAATGEILWKQRLGEKRSWSSTVYAEGRLYMGNTSGSTFVIEPNPTKCHILAENHLNETTRSSPAFSDGQIFIRTWQHLHCLETP